MRKVLSFVLVLSLVLGSFGMAFAAPLSDVAGEDFEDAVNVLTELGVVSGYPDGTYKPDNIVTRAEMAVIVVRALGLADYAIGTANFSDMGGHWSNPYVAYAASLGIIAGYPDGTFRPDKTVSYDEAATMLVAALGYNADSLVGTWPANFVVKAKSLGILDGIKAGAAGANRGDIAVMAYQTLGVKIGSTDKDGKWTANDPVDTMLERLGAKLYDPDETDNALPNPQPGDPFVLTNTHADNAVANVRDFIGAYVTAYANDDYEIIAIKEVKSVFLTGEFDKTFVAGAWPANTDFETDDQDYDLEIASLTYTNGTDDFRNGETGALTDVVPTAGVTYKIAADVSGKKIKDIYSVSEWSINDDFLFEDDMLEDDNLNSHDFKLDDNDEIEAGSYALVGVDSLEDIEEGNVVYVYTAAGEITRIEVGTEVVTGTVTRISSDAKTITVDGKAYKYADDQLTLSGPDVTANGDVSIDDEVELTLDVNGYIYSIDSVTSSGGNYAMVLEVEDKTSGLSGRDAAVKLFLADGTTKVFNVDSDFADTDTSLINKGAWVDTAGTRFDTTPATEGKALVTLLVEYSVDKDGVIDFIDEVSFTNSTTTAATTELTSRNYYDGYAVASDAIMFTYDGTDPSDDDNYGVTTVAKASGSKFAADYLVKSQKIKVMVTAGLGTAADEVYGVFVGKAEVSGGTGYEVTMLVDGKEVVYEATSKGYAAVDATLAGGPPALEAEDQLLRLVFNAAGELKDAEPAFDGETPDTGFAKTDADVNSVVVDTDVTIAVKNNVATVTATNVSGLRDWSTFAPGDDITVDSDAVIYKVNADGDWVKGSISDLKMTGATKEVSFFDVFGDDKIADIVLIK